LSHRRGLACRHVKRKLIASSMQRREKREKIFGDDFRACVSRPSRSLCCHCMNNHLMRSGFLGELSVAFGVTLIATQFLSFVYMVMKWDAATWNYWLWDAVLSFVCSTVSVAGENSTTHMSPRCDSNCFPHRHGSCRDTQ
jgi:hypothetical protein